ncbi:MAG: protein translocase SEC61 complex subunit gamma [Methanomicrobiales archaeon]|nr:protein translocase SEC61 complex subunit gamma [Methanomicrobiales archaeon]MDI6876117.1 protein translocase SEC61 complex subunit gamma [Methanomicrobiales archaeon]
MDFKKFQVEAKGFKIEEELFSKYWRILKLARTPTREEFQKIAIVAAAGILIVGLVGFLIYEFVLVLPH